MKAPKTLSLLLVPLLCVPAIASAQIIIDRYNSDGDPTQPVVTSDDDKKGDDKKKGDDDDDGGDDDDEGEDDDSKALSDDELTEVREELLKDLQKTHTKCMKLAEIRRPNKASITGNATWEVTEEGVAKFKQASTEVTMEMFFKDDADMKKLSESDRDALRIASNKTYNDCAGKGSDVKVAVKGKKGEVNVGFSVSHKNDKTTVALTESRDEDGGSVAIDL